MTNDTPISTEEYAVALLDKLGEIGAKLVCEDVPDTPDYNVQNLACSMQKTLEKYNGTENVGRE